MSAPEPFALVIPGHSRRGVVSKRCLRLVETAAAYAAERPPALVLFTGWCAGETSEADQMLARWPGRDDIELAAEPTARTTAENAARSLPLLLDRSLGRAVVVCSALHAPRVRYLFGRVYGHHGVGVEVLPVRWPPHPAAAARELAAASVARRQLRRALAEVRAHARGGRRDA